MEDSVGDGFDLKNGSFVEVFVNSISVGNFHGNFGYAETIYIYPPDYIQPNNDKDMTHLKDYDSAASFHHVCLFSKNKQQWVLEIMILVQIASTLMYFLL